MNDHFVKDHTMPCITAVTPTICKMMGITAPANAAPDYLKTIIRAAETKGVDKIDKCLVYAPDAIGLQMYQNNPRLFDAILKHAPIAVPLTSVIPSITPVCYASMFTGARPETHGIRKKEFPVLTCDTIFDALIHGGKKIAIATVKGSSIDRIFRKRDIRYFSEPDDQAVISRAVELIHTGKYDFIVAYNSEYDDILHPMTPFCPEAIEALKHHLRAFVELAKSTDAHWRNYNRMIWFAPDHGAHIDPRSGKGTHGDDIPQDMQVQHYIGIQRGQN